MTLTVQGFAEFWSVVPLVSFWNFCFVPQHSCHFKWFIFLASVPVKMAKRGTGVLCSANMKCNISSVRSMQDGTTAEILLLEDTCDYIFRCRGRIKNREASEMWWTRQKFGIPVHPRIWNLTVLTLPIHALLNFCLSICNSFGENYISTLCCEIRA